MPHTLSVRCICVPSSIRRFFSSSLRFRRRGRFTIESIPNVVDPSHNHAIVTRLEPEVKRVVVVGDVHGCVVELEALAEKVGLSDSTDLLVFVGDLVAKGPDSIGCVEFALKHRALMCAGNHELAVSNGSSSHHASVRDELSDAQLAWMTSLPLSIFLKELNVVVVHAGVNQHLDRTTSDGDDETDDVMGFLSRHAPSDLVTMRSIVMDPETKRPKPSSVFCDESWSVQYEGRTDIIFGHDALRGLQSANPKALGLDSGCLYGNGLSCVVINVETKEREIVKVDSHVVSAT